MGNTNDIRVIRTKRLLMNAFAELLEEKDFAEISVKDIVEKAEVARTTFYRNYLDKEDFVEKIKKELLEGVFIACEKERMPDRLTSEKYYQKFFEYFYKNRIFFNSFINSGKWSEFSEDFFEQGVAAYQEMIGEYNLNEGIPGDILIHYIIAAHTGVVQYWLKKNCPYSVEDMAKILTRITVDGPLKIAGLRAAQLKLPK
ncbi:MAG TPA: TetR/AcrR family transcriptional regulator [Candidatus Mediterraneibacter norfolkensis]|nr:TetR/AcrR family transcriptional regulator [Candidatus Mediterraneibacter norfolkensis]